MEWHKMKKILTQFKREFWESRASFIRTPMILAGILMLLLVLGQVTFQYKVGGNLNNLEFSSSNSDSKEPHPVSSENEHELDREFLHQLSSGELFSTHPQILGVGLGGIYILFALVLLLVLNSYFLGSLYSDRRDQSILFWKSLPVTERQNVLTKLGAGLLGAPMFYGAAALATGAFYLVLISVYAGLFLGLPLPGFGMMLVSYLGSIASLIVGWLLMSLWALPIFSWMMFCSALARKVPFLMAVGIPLVLIVLEFWVIGTSHIGDAVNDQIAGAIDSLHKVIPFPGQIGYELSRSLSEPALWAGVLLSGLLLAGCIWLRNYRYEI